MSAAAVVLVFCPSRAKAETEICPARLEIAAVGGKTGEVPAATYGFDLRALSERTISARLVLDTDDGSYAATVPKTPLQEHDLHYRSQAVEFVRREFWSPVMYAVLPRAAKLKTAFLENVVTDAPGWTSSGSVTCLPYGSTSFSKAPPHQPAAGGRFPQLTVHLDSRDDADLGASPAAGSQMIELRTDAPLTEPQCAEPFREARAFNPVAPDFPPSMRGAAGRTSVIVTLAANGHVDDASVLFPSGSPVFDEAALRAAAATRYEGAISYCTPIASQYIFITTFAPGP